MSELKRAIEIPPGHLIRYENDLYVTMESKGAGRRILRLTYCIGSTEVTETALFEDLGPVEGLAKNYRGPEVAGPGETKPRLWSVIYGARCEDVTKDTVSLFLYGTKHSITVDLTHEAAFKVVEQLLWAIKESKARETK